MPGGAASLDAQLQEAMREDLRVFPGQLLTGFATREEKGVHSVRAMQLLTELGWVDVRANYIPGRASPCATDGSDATAISSAPATSKQRRGYWWSGGQNRRACTGATPTPFAWRLFSHTTDPTERPHDLQLFSITPVKSRVRFIKLTGA